MQDLRFPMEKVLEVMDTADACLDSGFVKNKILDIFIDCCKAEGAIFFLPSTDFEFKDTLTRNFDEESSRTFYEYYHKFDPLCLFDGLRMHHDTPVELLDFDPYRSSEYYIDFLKPCGIHYKLVVYLELHERMRGKVVLTRSASSPIFSKEETAVAAELSPYMAYALIHNDLRRRIQLKDNLIKLIEEDFSAGIIMLDDFVRPIYMNQKAKAINEYFADHFPVSGGGIHPFLLKDCRVLLEETDRCPASGLMPKRRVIQGPDSRLFSICSKICEGKSYRDRSRILLVYIEENSDLGVLEEQRLKETFCLSKREVDVVMNIFKGMHNAEIARTLFVSEITVKKHLQNIYEKVGVNNRTSLINKILTQQNMYHLAS